MKKKLCFVIIVIIMLLSACSLEKQSELDANNLSNESSVNFASSEAETEPGEITQEETMEEETASEENFAECFVDAFGTTDEDIRQSMDDISAMLSNVYLDNRLCKMFSTGEYTYSVFHYNGKFWIKLTSYQGTEKATYQMNKKFLLWKGGDEVWHLNANASDAWGDDADAAVQEIAQGEFVVDDAKNLVFDHYFGKEVRLYTILEESMMRFLRSSIKKPEELCGEQAFSLSICDFNQYDYQYRCSGVTEHQSSGMVVWCESGQENDEDAYTCGYEHGSTCDYSPEEIMGFERSEVCILNVKGILDTKFSEEGLHRIEVGSKNSSYCAAACGAALSQAIELYLDGQDNSEGEVDVRLKGTLCMMSYKLVKSDLIAEVWICVDGAEPVLANIKYENARVLSNKKLDSYAEVVTVDVDETAVYSGSAADEAEAVVSFDLNLWVKDYKSVEN